MKNPVILQPGVLVVEASAGSGKTYTLAKRYIQILFSKLRDEESLALNHTLAITFTNKAAFTMKGRIREFLKKIALKELTAQEEKEILSPLRLTAQEAKPRAIALMDQLIHRYHLFQVQTIDSFINCLLSGCAFKIGFSAKFRIRRDHERFLHQSLDHLITSASADPQIHKLLTDFLHQYLFLENKNGWFPKNDMLQLLAALYSQSQTYGQDFHASAISVENMLASKRQVLEDMRRLKEILPLSAHSRFRENLEQFLMRYTQGFDFDQVSDYWAREQCPLRKGEDPSPELADLWNSIREQLRRISENEAKSLFNPYTKVFALVMKEFYQLEQKNDVVFLSELNRRTQTLFSEGIITVEELYYRLATKYRHFLLDEFQDTSRLQWQNLSPMITEALASGGTLFYVGDKKQAIYGFRGGDAGLFDEIKEHFRLFNVNSETLKTNYRSHRAIIDFNNQVFSAQNLSNFFSQMFAGDEENAFLSPADQREILKVFASAQQNLALEHTQGYVQVQYVDTANREDRETDLRERVLCLLKELTTRFAYEQIAVLARSNHEIEMMTSWLISAGIPVESERTLDIKKHPVILEIIAFLKFLDSPVDDLNFAYFVSGEAFSRASGLTQEALHSFLFHARCQRAQRQDVSFYRIFQEEHKDIWDELIRDFFKNVGYCPLYELAASILRRWRVFDHFAQEQGFFMRLLELIKEKESDYSDLSSFLLDLETMAPDELFVNVVHSHAVKVLTVHKAKGLEFPVVIIPFLGIKVRAASGGGLGQQSYILDFDDEGLRLLRIKNKYLKFSDRLSEIKRKERVRSFCIELNSIYVALTRAIQEMYLFIPSKISGSKNPLQALFPVDVQILGTRVESSPIHREKLFPGETLSASGEHNWLHFLKEEYSADKLEIGHDEILRGRVLHSILSQIKIISSHDQIMDMVRHGIEKAQGQYPQILNWSEYQDEVLHLFSKEAILALFTTAAQHVMTEQEIVSPSGQVRRLDRIVITQSEYLIVDFKSGGKKGLIPHMDHIVQVREYMQYAKAMKPELRVRGFLVYIDSASCFEVGDFDAVPVKEFRG